MNFENLKNARKKKNLTQNDISELLGLSSNTYRNYEQGTREPNNEILCRIADILEVSTDYLLGRELIQNPLQFLQDVSINPETMTSLELYMAMPKQVQKIFIDFLIQLSTVDYTEQTNKTRVAERLGDLYEQKEKNKQAEEKEKTSFA